jgi:hypothetical protein
MCAHVFAREFLHKWWRGVHGTGSVFGRKDAKTKEKQRQLNNE